MPVKQGVSRVDYPEGMPCIGSRAVGAVVLFLFPAACVGQQAEDERRRFEEAERQIVRLPPTAFPELPDSIVRELQHRGCTIPQEADARAPHNVISGQFAKPRQTDWAVLCSLKRASSILVFWAGSATNPAEIAQVPNRTYLQKTATAEIGFCRRISPAERELVISQFNRFGGTAPAPIDHQGINDVLIFRKASLTYYFKDGEWLGSRLRY